MEGQVELEIFQTRGLMSVVQGEGGTEGLPRHHRLLTDSQGDDIAHLVSVGIVIWLELFFNHTFLGIHIHVQRNITGMALIVGAEVSAPGLVAINPLVLFHTCYSAIKNGENSII